MFVSNFLLTYVILAESVALQLQFRDEKKPFTLQEALFYFKPAKFESRWISDSEFQYFVPGVREIRIHDSDSGKDELLIDGLRLPRQNISYVKISPDRKFALVSHDLRPVYRHSSLARYFIYSIEHDWHVYLGNKSFIQLAEWGPKGNAIAYVKDNDLYYVPYFNPDEVKVVRITDTGKPDVIFNGVADWVYEEETLETDRAFYFSPSGHAIVFTVFNDSEVPLYRFPIYGEPGEQYPKIRNLRYPKVGQTNPTVSAYFYSTTTEEKPKLLKLATAKDMRFDIFLGQKFVNNDLILTGMANRVQNHSRFALCHVKRLTSCYTVYEHRNRKGWADLKFPLVSSKADRFLKIIPWSNGKGRSFPHLASYPIKQFLKKIGTPKFLTSGQYAVTSILGWDQEARVVYYEATKENEPSTKHVYSISENGTGRYCLSCRLASPEGRACESAVASFSFRFGHVILTCDGPDPPVTYLYRNVRPLQSPIALETNLDLRRRLLDKLLPDQLDLRVKIPGKFRAEVRLLLPPDFDPTGRTKYPFVNWVYGGPESKMIKDHFQINFSTYLTTNKSIIVALIDSRGTSKKELEMLHSVYRRLGTIEVQDQISVTRHLQRRFPFIDSKRTGIWGWSYGGYVTVKALLSDSRNLFKCGIAVAPAIDFLYYDTIYTERYMGLPTEDDNLMGYYKANAHKYVNFSNLNGKKFFLIHGSADDNVHYQHSMMFSKILQRNNILFEQQSYTDENHNIGRVLEHLYLSMSDFWGRCFDLTG